MFELEACRQRSGREVLIGALDQFCRLNIYNSRMSAILYWYWWQRHSTMPLMRYLLISFRLY